MWEQHNGELTNPASPASLCEHDRLDTLITHDYANLTTLAHRDRRWFRRPKEVIFTETLEYKQQWLESVCLARLRFARQNRTSTQAQRNLMRRTFRVPTLQAQQPNQIT
jgi:endonuclease/exonuclease/phosphatase (EEP) superfamily protein YafD